MKTACKITLVVALVLMSVADARSHMYGSFTPADAPAAVTTEAPAAATTAMPAAVTTEAPDAGDGGDFGSYGSFTPATPKPDAGDGGDDAPVLPTAADREASTTAVTSEITFAGMSAAEFTTNKVAIVGVVASGLNVHPSMITLNVAAGRRRLAADDTVVLELKVFVTPADAAAMVTKFAQASGTLAAGIENATGLTVVATVATATTQPGQTPPAAPTTAAPAAATLSGAPAQSAISCTSALVVALVAYNWN